MLPSKFGMKSAVLSITYFFYCRHVLKSWVCVCGGGGRGGGGAVIVCVCERQKYCLDLYKISTCPYDECVCKL